MKLAQVIAQQPLPAGSGVRQASTGADPVALGLQEVAQAGTVVAGAAGRAAELQARADDEKRKYQQALDASRTVSSTLDQLDQAETTLKMGQRDPATGEVLQAPATPAEYMPAWLKLRDKLTEDALAQATTPESKLVVTKLLEIPLRERQHGARKFSNDLFVSQYTTGVEDEVTSLAGRAVRDPDTLTPDGLPLWETRALGVLASAQGAIPEAKLRQLREQFTTQVDTAKARRLGEVNPEQAIDDLQAGKYRLPQDKADQLAASIETKWVTRVRQEEVAAKERAQAWEKAWHGYQQTQHADDYVAAREGTLTLDTLEQNRRDWHYTTAQYKELRDVIEAPLKDAKSDPGTLLRITADVNGLVPQTSEREIKALMANGQLSIADGGTALRQLSERKRQQQADARQLASEGRTAATQERTILHYDQAQAERQLKAAMGIPDILPPGFSPEVSAAYSQAVQKLANRSAAFPVNGGKENPLAAVRQIIPEAQQAAGIYGRVKEQDLIKLLPSDLGKLAAQGPDGFLAAARQLDAQRRALGEAEFGRIAQVFAEMRALYRDLQGAGVVPAPTPSTATPPGAFKVPKAPKGAQ